MATSDAYVQKMKAQIDEWNAELNKLKAQAEGATADARIEYSQQLTRLEALKANAETKIRELENAGESASEDLKEGIHAAWQDISTAFNDAIRKFK